MNVTIFTFIIFILMACHRNEVLRAGYPAKWGKLHPALQNNFYASVTLNYQFESLVTMGMSGVIEPLGANSWEISDDFQTYRFNIDTNRKFSDGSQLTAHDYKQAWEKGLQKAPDSFNNSLRDVLYKVEGFENFKELKSISGLKVINDGVLEIKFKSPFRQALDELKGARFAAYKTLPGDKIIGTGLYVIKNISEQSLLLIQNPYRLSSKKPAKINIKVISSTEAVEEIKNNKLDVYFSAKAHPKFNNLEAPLALLQGQESSHAAAHLNGKKGRIFSSKPNRKAFQYLIHKIFRENSKNTYSSIPGFKYDPQVYLPLQQGRITDIKTNEIIDSGKQSLQALIEETRNNPLLIYYDDDSEWIIEKLKSYGIKLHKDTKNTTVLGAKILDEIYKTHQSDVLFLSFSVSNGDPDGVYHLLGKNGAIHTPYVYRESVAESLEKGRSIFKRDQIDPFYQNVTQSILEEVPFVHLGFKTSIALYSDNRVRVAQEILNRNDSHLHAFELK